MRIGDSPPAPLLDVVAEPNDWQKTVRAATTQTVVSAKQALYVSFWEGVMARVRAEHPEWTGASRAPKDNWFQFGSSLPGTYIAFVFSPQRKVRAQLWIENGDGAANRVAFRRLLANRASLEQEFGEELEFSDAAARRACRIGRVGAGDVTDTDDHERIRAWFIDSGVRWRRAIDAVRPALGAVGLWG